MAERLGHCHRRRRAGRRRARAGPARQRLYGDAARSARTGSSRRRSAQHCAVARQPPDPGAARRVAVADRSNADPAYRGFAARGFWPRRVERRRRPACRRSVMSRAMPRCSARWPARSRAAPKRMAGCAAREVSGDANVAVATVDAAGTRQLAARLIAIADGGAQLNSAHVKTRDYRQSALVCDVASEQPHQNRAFERFTPEGPLALLPTARGWSLVWTARPEHAQRTGGAGRRRILRRIARDIRQRGRRVPRARQAPSVSAGAQVRDAAGRAAHGADRQCGTNLASGCRPGLQSRLARRVGAGARHRATSAIPAAVSY